MVVSTRARNIEHAKEVKTAGQGSFLGSESTICSAYQVWRKASLRRKSKRQQRMNIMKVMIKKIRSEVRIVGLSVSCWLKSVS